MFNSILNTPLQFSIICHSSSTYATFLGSFSNFGVRILQVIYARSDWVSPNHICGQLHNTTANNLNRLCYITLNFFTEPRFIYFFSDPPHLLKPHRNPCVIQDLDFPHFMWKNDISLLVTILQHYNKDLDRSSKLLPNLTNEHVYLDYKMYRIIFKWNYT